GWGGLWGCGEDAGSWHRSGRRIGRTLTVWISAAEVLAALLGSPLYRAVSEWLPTASEETVKLAVPAASVPVPNFVPPSNKLTDPVSESPHTFLVNFIGGPKHDGFCDDDIAVVVPTGP